MKRLALLVLAVATLLAGRHAVAGPQPEPMPLTLPNPVPVAPTGTGDTTHLTPALTRALARATAAADAAGVRLDVTSGWRSRAHQQSLYDDAVRTYGSAEKASRWVLRPGRSAHVRGEAVDVGPKAGARWLEENGVRFGLCRRYDNEYWHFELLAAAKGSACPRREAHA